MTNDAHLASLLMNQDLTPGEENTLRGLRESIESQMKQLEGSPRIYYGGSFGKHTMVRESYDLDIVVYWPPDSRFTVQGISDGVGTKLQKHWNSPRPKTVSWVLRFQGGFHIDVVPGRAIDAGFREANLWRRDKQSTLKTSIKTQIKTVRDSGRRDAIRLVKLWKARHGIDCKTFWLELLIIEGCKGVSGGLEQELLAAFRYLGDRALTARVLDPANSNNVISDDVPRATKLLVAQAAQAAIGARYWSEVFNPK
jgi:hypothetical protein